MVLILESRSHLDLGDLPNLHAAELGVMTVRIERAIRSLDGVERVHVNRWGDGAAHFHQWFLGAPNRLSATPRFVPVPVGRHPGADPGSALAREPRTRRGVARGLRRPSDRRAAAHRVARAEPLRRRRRVDAERGRDRRLTAGSAPQADGATQAENGGAVRRSARRAGSARRRRSIEPTCRQTHRRTAQAGEPTERRCRLRPEPLRPSDSAQADGRRRAGDGNAAATRDDAKADGFSAFSPASKATAPAPRKPADDAAPNGKPPTRVGHRRGADGAADRHGSRHRLGGVTAGGRAAQRATPETDWTISDDELESSDILAR